MIFSIFAIITVLIHEVMFGGRLKVVLNVIGIAFIYHYGVKNIRIRQAIVFVMTILMGFLIIHFSRMGVANLPAGVQALTVDILMSTSVDETAFALRHFPEDVPFMGIGIMSGGLSHLVPTIGRYMNWNKNIWSVIVEYLRGG